MSRRLEVAVCRRCGRVLFPPRLLCPGCGGASWRREPARGGVVEEATTVAGADGAAVRLASVRLDAGPVVVACLEGEPGPDGRVELAADGGAPVSRAP